MLPRWNTSMLSSSFCKHRLDGGEDLGHAVVVVVVDFIILLGESQQAVPFYWEP